eukprot:scaffold2842_cov277-Pinguiococcus_pyrenoidosus.AAC.2
MLLPRTNSTTRRVVVPPRAACVRWSRLVHGFAELGLVTLLQILVTERRRDVDAKQTFHIGGNHAENVGGGYDARAALGTFLAAAAATFAAHPRTCAAHSASLVDESIHTEVAAGHAARAGRVDGAIDVAAFAAVARLTRINHTVSAELVNKDEAATSEVDGRIQAGVPSVGDGQLHRHLLTRQDWRELRLQQNGDPVVGGGDRRKGVIARVVVFEGFAVHAVVDVVDADRAAVEGGHVHSVNEEGEDVVEGGVHELVVLLRGKDVLEGHVPGLGVGDAKLKHCGVLGALRDKSIKVGVARRIRVDGAVVGGIAQLRRQIRPTRGEDESDFVAELLRDVVARIQACDAGRDGTASVRDVGEDASSIGAIS